MNTKSHGEPVVLTDEWSQFKHFSESENWGEPDRIHFELVRELDLFRRHLDRAVLITCGTQGVHSAGSDHYLGWAADVVISGTTPKDLADLFIAVSRFGFTGIGIYPHWQHNGAVCGGLHLSAKPRPVRTYWMGIPDAGGQKYFGLSRENLLRLTGPA